MRFTPDWVSLIVGSKFTVFALFYFVFESNFPSTSFRGLIFGGAIQQGVFCVTGLGGLCLEGLIHGGAYFRNFMVVSIFMLQTNFLTSFHLSTYLSL